METEYKGYVITIEQDEDVESPRDFQDNLGTMLCWHNRYNLGDNVKYGYSYRAGKTDLNFYDVEDFNEWLKENKKQVLVMLPLILYDHSGLAMSTTRQYPFNCPWDSGQVGWIFVTKDQVRKEYKVKRITKQLKNKITSYLESEVETYNQYLQDDVYWFCVEDSEGNMIDSCGGYYGYDECVKAAQEAADYALSHAGIAENI